VVLSEAERARLHTLIGQGIAPAHARILLKANQGEAGPGWTDRAIATALEVHHHTTVARVRQQYAAGGKAGVGGRRVAGDAQRLRSWGRLALHHRGRPDQAQAPLPCNPGLTTCWSACRAARHRPVVLSVQYGRAAALHAGAEGWSGERRDPVSDHRASHACVHHARPAGQPPQRGLAQPHSCGARAKTPEVVAGYRCSRSE
jgi:hypothetical protein